ncbi:hypothetical protein [Enterococcus diestrammenae]|uniref:hypothetical protein n=1 Tax=Enterococcus diestrammenae TaxID=1155073 RepID=UPI0022E99093|nr:hypothetical protein [Enterococcus diestrammenae]
MSYFGFLAKQFYKKRSNLLIIGIFLTLIFFYGLSLLNTNPKGEFVSQIDSQLEELDKQRKEGNLESDTEHSEYTTFLNQQYDQLLNIKKDYSRGDHKKAYTEYLTILKDMKKQIGNEESRPTWWAESVEKQILYLEALSEQNIPYETPGGLSSAFGFPLKVVNNLFPILMTFVVVLLVTTIFVSPYIGTLNKDSVLPYPIILETLQKLLLSCGVAVVVIGLTICISWITGSFVGGSSSLELPIFKYVDQKLSVSPIKAILPQAVLLYSVALFSVVTITCLVATILKNSLSTVFTALIINIIQMFAIPQLPQLTKIAHLLPGVYLESGNTVTGILSENYHNSKITLQNGIIVNLLITTITFFIIYLVMRLEQQHKKVKYNTVVGK